MYQITEFAKIFHVSANTLRFYEKKGIFEPAYRQPETGYRYYTEEQVLEFSNLLDLKHMDFSVSDIKQWKDGRMPIGEIKQQLVTRQRKIEYTLEVLDIIEQARNNPNRIYRYKCKPVMTLRKKLRKMSVEKLKKNIMDTFYALAELNTGVLEDYHSFVEFTDEVPTFEDFACTVHFPVYTSVQVYNSMDFKEIGLEAEIYPETRFICTNFVGGYDTIDEAYERLFTYMQEQKMELSGCCVERYLSYFSDENRELVTEIWCPISEEDYNRIPDL